MKVDSSKVDSSKVDSSKVDSSKVDSSGKAYERLSKNELFEKIIEACKSEFKTIDEIATEINRTTVI